MRDWSVETWALFVSVVIAPLIAALTTMAVKIIGALRGISEAMDRTTEAANGIVHELMTKSGEAAHAQGMMEGMEKGRGEVTVPIAPQELVLSPKPKEEELS